MPGRAEAALQAVVLPEGLLQRMQHAVLHQALDRRDLGAVGLHREHQARAGRLAVDQHRARPADAVLAADVRAGEPQVLAQEVDQQLARRGSGPRGASPLTVRRTVIVARSSRALHGPARARARSARRSDGGDRPRWRARRCRASTSSAARAAAAWIAASPRPSRSRIASASRSRIGTGPAPAVASRAIVHRAPSRTTIAAMPTIAKSPCRRANSSKAYPTARGHGRQPHFDQQLVGGQPRGQVRLEQLAGVERAAAARALGHDRSVERGQHRRVLRRGIGVGERAADGAARADRQVTDPARSLGQER